MGLTSALYTGLSGLNSNQFRIDVIGDNIANVNTTAFKGTRSLFQTQFSQNFDLGTAPGTREGGTNPIQFGLGSTLGSVQRNFDPGSIETTGVSTDIAIEGEGFFVLRTAAGQQYYTRDGTFTLSATNEIISSDGFRLQGFGVDENFNIIEGALSNLEIPLGTLSIAQATENVKIEGNLSPDAGDIGEAGAVLLSNTLYSDAAGTTAATAATPLENLYIEQSAGTFVQAFPPAGATDPDIELTLGSAEKGTRVLDDSTFTVAAGQTLQDLMDFLDLALGIQDGTGVPGTEIAGSTVTPGVDLVAGQIRIVGNHGEKANDLKIDPSDIVVTGGDPAAEPVATPFTFTNDLNVGPNQGHASGSSVSTKMQVFDSLGTPLDVVVDFVLEDKDTTGVTWRFYLSSADDSDVDLALSTGTLKFDSEGRMLATSGTAFVVNRANTGATDPLGITLDLSDLTGLVTEMVVAPTEQDGFPAGTLQAFGIGGNGMITGTFTNGLTRTLGQVALATFANPAGLVQSANNVFVTAPNSGDPVIAPPTTLGAGRLLAGSLELSNVDLSQQFIGLITASTGFSAASRVITTSDELLQELLLMTR